MATISIERIDQVANQIIDLDDEKEIEVFMDDLEERQPLLTTFLLSVWEEDFNDDENELFQYLGFVVIKLGDEYPPVDESRLESVRADNQRWLEDLHGASEVETANIIEEMIHGHSQQPLLEFVRDSIDEEGEWVRLSNQGMIFFLTKVMVDCIFRND